MRWRTTPGFATSATDRERFRVFRHTLAEKANDRVRRTGFGKFSTDYAVPLHKNRRDDGHLPPRSRRRCPGRYENLPDTSATPIVHVVTAFPKPATNSNAAKKS